MKDVDTSEKAPRGERWVGWAVMILLVLGLWFVINLLAERGTGSVLQLPPLPDLTDRPMVMVAQLRSADAEARHEAGDPNRVGLLGRAYHANGFYDLARRCYQRAEQLDAHLWQWHYYQAMLDESLGDLEAVVRHLGHVIAIDPAHELAWYRLGEVRFKLQQYEKAEQAYQRALASRIAGGRITSPKNQPLASRRFPTQDYATLGLARVQIAQKRSEDAVQILCLLLHRSPRFGPAHRVLAQAYKQLGRESQARRHQDQANDLTHYLPPADPMFDALLRESYDVALLRKHAAIAQTKRNNTWGFYLASRALEADSKDVGAVKLLAELSYDAKQWQVAEKFYIQLLALKPRELDAHANLAKALRLQGKYAEAIPHYEALLARKPDTFEMHNGMGTSLARLGRIDEALVHFQEGARLEPDSIGVRINMAQALESLGRLEEAGEQCREAQRLDPKIYSRLEQQGQVPAQR